MSDLNPSLFNVHDATALAAALALIVAGGDTPRVDVTLATSEWNTRAPYLAGRLFVRGGCHTYAGEITGYHLWYVYARLGLQVPVREYIEAWGVGATRLYAAAFDKFTCLPRESKYQPNGANDAWRDIFDDALAAL